MNPQSYTDLLNLHGEATRGRNKQMMEYFDSILTKLDKAIEITTRTVGNYETPVVGWNEPDLMGDKFSFIYW